MGSDLNTRLKAHMKMGGIVHKEVYDDIKKAVLEFRQELSKSPEYLELRIKYKKIFGDFNKE